MAVETLNSAETKTTNGISIKVYRPSIEITNEEIERWNIITPHGNIITAALILDKIGAKKRYVESEDEFFMAGKAAYEALWNKRGEEKRIDAIFVATGFPERKPLSKRLNEHLKLNAQYTKDVHAACSGFVRTLTEIKQNEANFKGKRIMIVTSEKYSDKVFDLRQDGFSADPSLAQTIFSDGATATIFVYGKDVTVLQAKNQLLPLELSGAITMPLNYGLISDPNCVIVEEVPVSKSGKIEQNGPLVYEAVLRYIPNLIRKTVEEAGLEPRDIDLVIPHQGSIRMITGLEKKLPEYKGKIVLDVEEGNF